MPLLIPQGVYYTAQAPDTLDLADRMDLAINALTNAWAPDEKWALLFIVDFSRRPPVLFPSHVTDAYLNIPAKFLEALLVCRLATGNVDNIDVDRNVLKAQEALLGPDGLTYCPLETLAELKEHRPFSEVWGEGRLLVALSMLAQTDKDDRWIEIGKRKVDRLLALSREKDGFRFLWTGRFRPGDSVPVDADEPSAPEASGSLATHDPVFNMIYSIGALGHGAGLLYRVSGYEPALELSGGLAKWALARVFKNEDGRYNFWHFHHGLYALMAVCEYACAANDRRMLERVDACYRWAREMGDPLIGFYTELMPGTNEYLARDGGNPVETCEVTDMVFLALYLTRAGMGDYWDDVDRWLRNVYAEAQMVDTGFLEHIPESWFSPEPGTRPHADVNNIANRSLGSFWCSMHANDGLRAVRTPDGPRLSSSSIAHCCTANGARTMYYAWDSIVTRHPDEVRVNLLLNRASPWLDVDSYVPAAGKVVLRIKNAPRIAVRMPEWCDPRQVAVTVAGENRCALVDGRFLRTGWLRPGDTVTLTFPLPERTVHRILGGIPYKLVLRGSNVVAIDPKGTACPLYEHQPTGRLVEKRRFLPSTEGLIW